MKLKIALIRYGITIKQLANHLGVSRQSVSNHINKGVPWNEKDMKIILSFFKSFDTNIKYEDLFF